MQKRTMAILGVIFAGLLAYVLLVEVGREEQREEREDLAKQILPTTEDDVFGLWRGRPEDGLAFEDRVREEWS